MFFIQNINAHTLKEEQCTKTFNRLSKRISDASFTCPTEYENSHFKTIQSKK